MPINDKLINDVSGLVDELSQKDITHQDLGKHGFLEAQEILSQVCADVSELIRLIQVQTDAVQHAFVNQTLTRLREKLKEFSSHVGAIDQLSSQIGQAGDFVNRRKSEIKWFHNSAVETKNIIAPLQADLKLRELESKTDPDRYRQLYEEAQQRVEAAVARAEEKSEQLAHMLSLRRGDIAAERVEIASTGFSELQGAHRKLAIAWFIASLLFGLMTAGTVAYVFLAPIPESTWESLVPYVLKRLLLFSIAVAGLRICLSKFNVERNLQIVYKHRQTVLDQYTQFDSAIADDEAKNQLRLEIAKAIFSDPSTGYIGQKEGSELNINPIIGMIDKSIPKSP